ncbi:MAG: hypothetical protein KF910_09575 [Brevundimonas sp.]|uniref:hypothetical protein n=1 Tax=Brevundimonas sp. TaxID=1871086 RepID=UPI0025C5BADA|nr:hypothetical protein [Brevundimonas sp.]MBX3477848.1 hypothetical protein [Brevundimonas sp.]
MKRIIIAFGAIGLLTVGLGACDNFQPPRDDQADTAPDAVEPMADAAEDAAAPAADPSAVDPAPAPTPLPADNRTNEESVKPESETLFY